LGELENLLDRKLQSALSTVERLKKDGLSEHQAFEAATQSVLAPSDGPAFSDNPPEPLDYEEQRKVYARLEARELGNRNAAERRSKLHLA